MDRLTDGWPWKDDYKERRIIKYNNISLTVPGNSVTGIAISSSSPFSLEYTWSPPSTPNGIIIRYNLTINFHNSSEPLVTTTNQPKYTLIGLQPYQQITLNISAGTIVGNGPSISFNQRTDQYSEPVTLHFLI